MATKKKSTPSGATGKVGPVGQTHDALFEKTLAELANRDTERGSAARFARKYADQIESVRKRGWTYQDIAEHFAAKGGPELTGDQLMNAISKFRALQEKAPKRKQASKR